MVIGYRSSLLLSDTFTGRVVDGRVVLILIGRGRVVVGREWLGSTVLARKGGGRVLDGRIEECGGLCIE